MVNWAFHRFLKMATSLACMSVPMLAQAQTLGGGESPDISIWRILLALLFCLLIAVLVIWLFYNRNMTGSTGQLPDWLGQISKMGRNSQSGEIQVIEMRKLNAQTDICLLRCREFEYLILLGGAQPEILEKNIIDELEDDAA